MKKNIPFIGHFEITKKCPFECPFCYSKAENDKKEINLAQKIDLINQFKDMGCIHLHLSGGEPLISKDFCAIYKHIILSGIKVTIESNMSLLTKDCLDLLKRYPPIKIYISLYGFTDQTHRITTKSNISINTIKKNIETLLENNLNILIRTPVSKFNFHELDLIYEYTKLLKASFGFDPKVWWDQLGERKHTIRCKFNDIEPFITKHHIFKKLYDQLKKLESQPYKISKCSWGNEEFYVNPYGELHYCTVFWKDRYSLIKGSFKEGWEKWYPSYKKNNVCIGRDIFPTDKDCPSGYLYFNKDLDVSKSLSFYKKINL